MALNRIEISLSPITAIALAAGMAIPLIPWLSTGVGMKLLGFAGVSGLFAAYILFRGVKDERALIFNICGLSWFLLAVSEAIFVRVGSIEDAYLGDFDPNVWGEIAIWLVSLSMLILIWMRNPHLIRGLMRGNFRWLVLYAALVMVSALYSPAPAYSAAWGMKFAIIILSIGFWSQAVIDMKGVHGILRIMQLALLANATLPFMQVFTNSGGVFAGGRFGGLFAPTGVSATGAALFLISIFMWEIENARFWKAISLLGGFLGLLTMFAGVGKVAMGSCALAALAYGVLARRIRFAAGIIALVGLLIGLTGQIVNLPMLEYIQSYRESALGVTLTGRTELWQSALGEIANRPIIGHGYLASKYSSLFFKQINWPSGHMHNAFIEVFYNNGIVGLILFALLNYLLTSNLLRLLRNSREASLRSISAGLTALYLFILFNGMFSSYFGGRPGSGYMIFLTLLIISDGNWALMSAALILVSADICYHEFGDLPLIADGLLL